MEFPQRTAPLRPVRTKVRVTRSELIWMRDEARRRGHVWTGRPNLGALVRPWIHPHVVKIAKSYPDDWNPPVISEAPEQPTADLWIYLDSGSRNLITRYSAYFKVPRGRVLYQWLRDHLPKKRRRAA